MNNIKNLGLWLVIIILFVALFNMFGQSGTDRGAREMTYSELTRNIESGTVSEVKISGERLTGTLEGSGRTFYTYLPQDSNLMEKLEASDTNIIVDPQDRNPLVADYSAGSRSCC